MNTKGNQESTHRKPQRMSGNHQKHGEYLKVTIFLVLYNHTELIKTVLGLFHNREIVKGTLINLLLEEFYIPGKIHPRETFRSLKKKKKSVYE